MNKPLDKPKHASQFIPMKKPSKVIPFSIQKTRFIASDDQSRRVMMGIGKQRIALDFSTRITELPPATGDQPASIFLIRKASKRNRSSTAK